MQLFKGFNDWIEIFRGGVQTDSRGNSRNWTNDDLDEIVANHSVDDPAPAVIGHPKADAPAYGWTGGGLKRVGNVLLAKFNEVESAFEEKVKAGRYKKRSSAIVLAKDGTFKLRHVGWLGAAAPAVDLKNPTFCAFADDGEDMMLFESDWYTPSLLSQSLRRLRDWIISVSGLKTANEVIPEYMIESAKSQSDSMRESDGDTPEFTGHFMSHPNLQSSDLQLPNEDTTVPKEDKKEFTQAELDDAVSVAEKTFSKKQGDLQADLDKQRHATRVTEFQAVIDTATNEGRMVPAMTAGLAEFMASLPEGDGAEFTFSTGDDKKETKQSPAEYFSGFIGNLPKAFASLFEELAGEDVDASSVQDFHAPDGYAVNQESQGLHKKALEYQAQHKDVSYLDAVVAVDQ